MDVYGLTGGIGSGKSAVAALLEEHGIPVVSADELSRVVVAPGTEGLGDVVAAFGSDILGSDGELDRAAMATRVFSDPEQRRRLEAILHPRIRERYEQVLDALAAAGHEVAVYEVPLLFEKNLQGDMKGVILVTAAEGTRISRVIARDGIGEGQVRARIAAQMDEASKRKRAHYVIENDGDLQDLRREVEFLLARYLRVQRRRVAPVRERAAEGLDRGAPRMVGGDDTQVVRMPSAPPPAAAAPLPSQRPTLTPEPAPRAAAKRPSPPAAPPTSVPSPPSPPPPPPPPPPAAAAPAVGASPATGSLPPPPPTSRPKT